MISKMNPDNPSYPEGCSANRLVNLREIPFQISGMNHHTPVETAQDFLLLCVQLKGCHYHQKDCKVFNHLLIPGNSYVQEEEYYSV